MIFNYGCYIVYFKIKPVDITFLFFTGKIKLGIAVFKVLIGESRLVIFIGIGPAMKPDEMKGVGGVVDIFDFLKTIQAVVPVIQGDIDLVIDLLLPVPGLTLRY